MDGWMVKETVQEIKVLQICKFIGHFPFSGASATLTSVSQNCRHKGGEGWDNGGIYFPPLTFLIEFYSSVALMLSTLNKWQVVFN